MPDLLPPNATPFERAFAQAAVYPPLEQPIKTLWNPQTCPEAHLPWLAWALSVDEWDAAWPAEMKRQAVAGSIEQHRKKGTVGALRRALQQLGYEVEIDERTGTAYTFKLRFKVREGESAGGAVVESAITKATQVALRQKNARSELLGTDLIAETDPVKMYVGGASVSGAEVAISPPSLTMPLDAYRGNMLTSFWTVRVNSDYTGPIGRVKRASDNAEIDYYSINELASFVGGTTWTWQRLYSQNNNFKLTAYPYGSGGFTTTLRHPGEFDSNGIPRIMPSTSQLRLACSLPITITKKMSAVFAAAPPTVPQFQSFDCGAYTLGYSANSNNTFSCGYTASSGPLAQIRTATKQNGIIYTRSRSISASDPKVFGAIYDNVNQTILDDDGETSQALQTEFKANFAWACLLPNAGNARFYGSTIWTFDMNESEMAELITSLQSHLQF